MSIHEDDDIDDLVEASLKKFRLNDVSPGIAGNVVIRNHEEIDVSGPVKELITSSENSGKNPFVLYDADLESVTKGI